MYVPSALASGKTLYVDVWYPYTPAAPYLNAVLFRLFGVKLSVLYWAGALAALSCASLLYSTGLHLGSRIAAWTVSAAFLIQAFQPWLFCFPLGYSFGAVYASVAACLFLWLVVNACSRPGAIWIFWESLAAAAASLSKLEIGAGCFVALGLFIICMAKREKNLRRFLHNLFAAAPGVVSCAAVALWMISLRGPEFLTQENLMSWPTTYFMQRYGLRWLEFTGLGLGLKSLIKVCALAGWAGMWLALRWLSKRYKNSRLALYLFLVLLALVMLVDSAHYDRRVTRALFYPPALLFVIAVMLPVTLRVCKRRDFSGGSLKVVMSFAVAVLIASRSLIAIDTSYGLYYSGPAGLAFLFILRWTMLPERIPPRENALTDLPLNLAPSVAMLAAVISLVAPKYIEGMKKTPVHTERGTIYVERGKAEAYQDAIHFIQDGRRKSRSVLVVPEDTSLYFLSGVTPPTRFYSFTPGVLAPGKMVEAVIDQLESHEVKYLIWSNRTFPEYGVPQFGLDFDKEFGRYLMTRYRPAVGLQPFHGGVWRAVVWERW
jgi:hypothetical protein